MTYDRARIRVTCIFGGTDDMTAVEDSETKLQHASSSFCKTNLTLKSCRYLHVNCFSLSSRNVHTKHVLLNSVG